MKFITACVLALAERHSVPWAPCCFTHCFELQPYGCVINLSCSRNPTRASRGIHLDALWLSERWESTGQHRADHDRFQVSPETLLVRTAHACMSACVRAQSRLTLSDPMVCGPPALSMGFPRQEYWSGLPFPSPGNLPNPGIEFASLESPALAGGFFITSLSSGHPILKLGCLATFFPSG